MGMSFFSLLLLSLVLSFSQLASSTSQALSKGSYLSVEKPEDVLVSPNGQFSAGFHPVGDNAYCFAIWFSKPPDVRNRTMVWIANRDEPVNGKRSKLSLLKNGNLTLTDADKLQVWATGTVSVSSVQLQLYDTGNLVLITLERVILWQSFDSVTDTILPNQLLTQSTKLVSSRSPSNYSSGFYTFFFDNDNVLRLLYDGREISSAYWPPPWTVSWKAGRTPANNSRIAILDSSGHFQSSDGLEFWSADYGEKLQRRLTLDSDGNVRVYSREEETETWAVTWQAFSSPGVIHGVCGPNSLCIYAPTGLTCSCIPGYKMINRIDWSYGCEPEFNLSCNDGQVGFLKLAHVEFYGYDLGFFPNYTLESCKKLCLHFCCAGFQYKTNTSGINNCFPKSSLLNGQRSPSFGGDLYLKLPEAALSLYDKPIENLSLNCSGEIRQQLDRKYMKRRKNELLRFMLWFACAVGGVEMICFFLVMCFLARNQIPGAIMQGYLLAATGFKKFTYAELKKATRNFSEEIGRGGGGVVYKGILSDHRVVAIKRLNEANQGEAEFLAEVSTIGKLNHMNLIEMWGYCAEGKHRLLVYEYMEHGSLADNLSSVALDWEKRFEIALGTAKCLAYLHEECLEWVLHCDVKPQNILLDSNYHPKVADFGLSKLLNRGGLNDSSFSTIRGTRGYMAPEWVFNLPITSKVDVYSYGIVVLEMVTGKSPMTGVESGGDMEQRRLVAWVREKMNGAATMASWMEEIIDPMIEGKHDTSKMETLAAVALRCVEEDRDERPTMSQVVEMLLRHENDH
ncbi:hypothetical protein L1049_025778 [Liquidambar formosana]|uniref:Receptor-like serine/threonine-protein kinase n=1 Tax=Liquidambar formosana TaxID=63359 RepID=A0AAP0NDJ2_LIQFO